MSNRIVFPAEERRNNSIQEAGSDQHIAHGREPGGMGHHTVPVQERLRMACRNNSENASTGYNKGEEGSRLKMDRNRMPSINTGIWDAGKWAT